MSGHEAQLLARAEELDETSELARQVIAILGSGRAAGLDTRDALGGLIRAALTLEGDHLAIYRARGAPFADERELADALLDAEDEIMEWLAEAHRTQAQAMAALAAAQEGISEAEGRIAEAQQRIALAEEALAILGPLIDRLRRALAHIRRVPQDLGEYYEGWYEHLRLGRQGPHDGRWITGEGAELAPPTRDAGGRCGCGYPACRSGELPSALRASS